MMTLIRRINTDKISVEIRQIGVIIGQRTFWNCLFGISSAINIAAHSDRRASTTR